jgi:dTDP-glucose pyrophosphorylase
MLNVVIPLAGLGSRFAKAGYSLPKPLIPVHGVPMIRLVIDNVRPTGPHRFVFICQRAHTQQFGLRQSLEAWSPGCAVVELDGVTEGAACTVLTAREFIDSDDALMIANSDQYVDIAIDDYLRAMTEEDLDGLIMTMWADDPKWSFARLDARGLVDLVVEKEVVSNCATVGIYNFKAGRDFVRAADDMIAKNLRVNNEFYVAPVYNQLIAERARIGIYDVGGVGRVWSRHAARPRRVHGTAPVQTRHARSRVIILSHRGYWKAAAEKNTPVAFSRSFDLGFGTETDVRDRNGELVISHDMPNGSEITLTAMLDILDGRDLPLAINIKADGLARLLNEQMQARGLTRWFTFDMSVPEMVVQLRLGLPVFSRASEYEEPPARYADALGIWLDGFTSQWYDVSKISGFLRDGKRVCIVSPELHGRDPKPLWALLKPSEVADHPALMLCTDLPEDAADWFGGKR